MNELHQLGRYQLKRVLGQGAMGMVYEGFDPKLNRLVAVKVILKSNANDLSMQAEYSARFVREAMAVARLNHPNIVTVFDFGEENDVAYLVMELIKGQELKHCFDEKKPFTVDDAVRIVCELLDALDYAHKNGVVHRDIKPANVMLDAQMGVKLTDFGVARLINSDDERTQAGTMVGTTNYMSPEQILGAPVGPRSDLFAVGIILYQFLTGEKPFIAQGAWAIQKKIVQEDPVLPTLRNPTLNPTFDTVVLRALAKKAEHRYPNAVAFKEALKLALYGIAPETADTTRLFLPTTIVTDSMIENGARQTLGVDQTGLEIEFWRSIKDSDDAKEFELYRQRFPNGVYVDLARHKLAKLHGETTVLSDQAKPPSPMDDETTGIATAPSTNNKSKTNSKMKRSPALDIVAPVLLAICGSIAIGVSYVVLIDIGKLVQVERVLTSNTSKAEQITTGATKAQQDKDANRPDEPPPSHSEVELVQKSSATLFAEAMEIEAQGNIRGAIPVYEKAAEAGSGPAAKRLYEIFSKGRGDIARDHAKASKWHSKATEHDAR